MATAAINFIFQPVFDFGCSGCLIYVSTHRAAPRAPSLNSLPPLFSFCSALLCSATRMFVPICCAVLIRSCRVVSRRVELCVTFVGWLRPIAPPRRAIHTAPSRARPPRRAVRTERAAAATETRARRDATRSCVIWRQP